MKNSQAATRRPKPAVVETAAEDVRHEPETKSRSRKEIPTFEPVEETEAPAKYRPADQRPMHDDAKLAAVGIHRYESKRLRLYTDIEPEIAEKLPPVVDQLYDSLVNYFGPLPPDEQGAEFQMTGYLIRDEVLFREQGLLEGVTTLLHGKHRHNRFWLREQEHDYYRRHLLLHECTHCYMTYVPGSIPPVWYMEGMAELFGTHRVKPDGTAEFRILPTERDDVGGWGRIALIRRICADHHSLTIRGVYDLPHDAFFKPDAYAWSWALCCFFDSHPRYAARFRSLGQYLTDGQFTVKFYEAFAHEQRNLSTEWTLFEHQLQLGYDARRAAMEFQPGNEMAEGEQRETKVVADRGWQDVGVRVEPGQQLEISGTGRFTLADNPKPWVSEPQGISFEYFNGSPLGRLIACLDVDPPEDTEDTAEVHLLHIEPVGKSRRLNMPAKGRLLLRLNDAWDSLSNNEGRVTVTIRRLADSPK